MNWLGIDRWAALGLALGCLLGALLCWWLLPTGHPAEWVVGLCAGLATALCTRERNIMRGFIVGTAAVWLGALLHATYLWPDASLLDRIASFHAALDGPTWLAHAASALLAIVLGSRSLRRRSSERVAGV